MTAPNHIKPDNAESPFDLAIIGGGIHGCAIAAEASSRGLKTVLYESGDLASGATSRSSTIIGGGLTQLEQLDFDAVNRGLQEQAILRQRAPHLVRQHQFIIHPNLAVRSRLRIKTGLYFYRTMQRRYGLSPKETLPPISNKALSYSDDSIDGSRLTIALAQQARAHGCSINPHTKVSDVKRLNDMWRLTLQSGSTNKPYLAQTAKILINASGGTGNNSQAVKIESNCRSHGRLVRDDYIVIEAEHTANQHAVLQANNRNLIHLLPYDHLPTNNKLQLLGPWQTCLDNRADNAEPLSPEAATQSLIELYNANFQNPISTHNLIEHYSCIRNLCEDPSGDNSHKLCTDYALDLDNPAEQAPLLNVLGGGLTTHRLVAEQAMNILQPFNHTACNPDLKRQPLPGGDLAEKSLADFEAELIFNYPRINPQLLRRLAANYGSDSYKILENRNDIIDLGNHFGADLYEAEVEYLHQHEWASCEDDLLWRRSKLGFCLSSDETEQLKLWFDQRRIKTV